MGTAIFMKLTLKKNDKAQSTFDESILSLLEGISSFLYLEPF